MALVLEEEEEEMPPKLGKLRGVDVTARLGVGALEAAATCLLEVISEPNWNGFCGGVKSAAGASVTRGLKLNATGAAGCSSLVVVVVVVVSVAFGTGNLKPWPAELSAFW